MKIVAPSVTFINAPDRQDLYKQIELAGRTCYKSEDKIHEGSAEQFIRNILKRGHEAVIEHGLITVRFTCDRGVTHEIVRHRVASYCQESTRYCNYSRDAFGNEITVIEPTGVNKGTPAYESWKYAMHCCEEAYFAMLAEGCTPQEARSVLSNSLKAEIVVSMNPREWRHFFKLRCSPAAHPDIRVLALMALDMFIENWPALFEDLVNAD